MPNALMSLSDKRGMEDFARRLANLGWTIYSTGGTATNLERAEIPVTEVAIYTGFPEIMGGRVKTLHPKIHGGILGVRSNSDHMAAMAEHDMIPFDLVVVNLYPFRETIAKPGVTHEAAIENIDVGGPAMLRSAAKNYESVTVVVDPDDYDTVAFNLERSGQTTLEMRKALAVKAFNHTAGYDDAITGYLSDGKHVGFSGERAAICNYGENAWQNPAYLYSTGSDDPLALDAFEVIEGMPPSYNNWIDLDRLLQTGTHIAQAYATNVATDPFTALGAKHGNLCGGSVGRSPEKTLRRMMDGDPLAIFGGLVMVNFEIEEKNCGPLVGKLLDAIIAPSFTKGAIDLLRRKSEKCRFIVNPALTSLAGRLDTAPRFRFVRGGFLTQPNYTFVPDFHNRDQMKFYGTNITPQIQRDLMLAWAIGSTSNSNTITLVREQQLIANAVGQQDRVGSANLALTRASRSKHKIEGAAAYSDSFFSHLDAPQALIDAGISAIFASSRPGKDKDQETIDLCLKHNVGLYLIPDAIGRGFFGH